MSGFTYDAIAKIYDLLLFPLEKFGIEKLRRRFVPMIEGYTLDLAVGTGNNIKYYPESSKVVLIDASSKMLKIAEEKAKKQAKNVNLKFVHSRLENLPFPDNFFDTILSIDVFCSVQDQQKALLEVERVLKPGGKAIFVEHMLTGKPLKDLWLYLFNVITYPTVGSSMTRRTLQNIEKSGLVILKVENLRGSFKYILCTKN
ncbi:MULTISPECIES: class I SAM-dependent methyltransferase [Kosmotoga]|uniref:Methyltransferase type 11 n=1 Tax=Kosmotoga olearia (strain ATCC BAA-1733 / DSM 21960 / TBF 19.5.1) TaxID=521045 RepID=C5CH10_KOSOT|nr:MULTISPECIES: methyltransferase domain-containing protein [Kosmotoga]ACR79675.1 Methyltransferase type 11 [Kosmotoga olearia TBF 19.5.1]OAA21915.1 methyltransferase type 11 [Kosmotoga sp. DU53]